MDIELAPVSLAAVQPRSPVRRPPAWTGWLFVSLVTATQVLATDPSPKKPAAEWTDEERFAARFAPGTAAARARAHNLALRAWLPEHALEFRRRLDLEATLGFEQFTDFVDGNLTPELFFPFELFETLLQMGFEHESDFACGYRKATTGRWKAFGLREDPEALIRQEAAALISAYRKERILSARLRALQADPLSGAKPLQTPEDIAAQDRDLADLLEAERQVVCGGAVRALAQMKKQMGDEQYSRFLNLLYATAAGGTGTQALNAVEELIRMYQNFLQGCPQ